MTTHTIETVLRDLRQIVSERPSGWTYDDEVAQRGLLRDSNCWYAVAGKPVCLVGQWLHRYAGVPASSMEGERAKALVFVPRHVPGVEKAATRLLQRAQKVQDCGAPWAAAVREAANEAWKDTANA